MSLTGLAAASPSGGAPAPVLLAQASSEAPNGAAPPAGPAPGTSTDDLPRIESTFAVLRWLDKSTARVDKVTVPVGTPTTLGGVDVTVQACRRTAPDQTPEDAAFLTILEHAPSDTEPGRPLFQGWMFASSPSLSAMEHPIYDVWVLECRDDRGPEADTAEDPDASDATASETETESQ
ncbi:DUF2155 domain-containing protein [Roseospira marina]|uniref:DUF2155 domain-containing protein n=1 Tax=Roseospira marina TaxID=140057 RepID=A0A5M6ID77_9PROT|nr:DUF2155 domain-containing protein [Roseospira marina]KAA5606234.1 DUF2155 domain-containing protein [Roseospira marina]MBB4314386.1 hypothetical protein [Roseospira marina]MBB5087546.1 hypothetical protein [Roseospira marina]